VSKFFKALQQAEQEQALRLPAERAGDRNARPSVAIEPAVMPDPHDPGMRSRDVRAGEVPREATAERTSAQTTIRGIEGVEEHLVSLLRPSSFEAAQYRSLSHGLERLRETGSVKVVGITSPSGGDGKTVTAINLAVALAQDARSRVLLLEADLRKPMVARYLGLADSNRGLVQAITRPGLPLEHAVTRLPGTRLDVLVAGHPSAAPYEALGSSRATEIVLEARQAYDHVVVDTPPLVGMPEGRVIERLVDGHLIVVRAQRTLRSLLDEALKIIDASKAIGLVFNGDNRLMLGFDGYHRYRDREASRNGHWRRPRHHER
jgi:protein-tyrosine kinase